MGDDVSPRILIVDDEPDVATYLATALRANGFSPTVAHTVEDGLKEVVDHPPDLICLDIMMPKHSGLSMLGKLKRDEATADIPVLVISGALGDGQFSLAEYSARYFVERPDRVLEKPVEVDTLLEAVNDLLANDRPRSKRDKT